MKMKKDQVTEISTDVDDLPQIRFTGKGAKNATEQFPDQLEIKQLSKIVEVSFKAIASATGLSDKEVLRAFKDTDVEMLKDILKDAQISDTFIAKKDDSLDGIVSRLHYRAQVSREKFGNTP
jgi:AraC-like DNA-binding protein